MRIVKAKNLGFCFGVRQSMSFLEQDNPLPVRTYGEIIHNAGIISKLEKKGIFAVDNLEAVDSGTLVIRSHGAPKEVLLEAEKKNIKLINAICPFVQKTRDIAENKYKEGFHIVIFGTKNHPEVIGICSVCDYKASVIEDINELPDLNNYDKVCLVAQTTSSEEKFEKLVDKINQMHLKVFEFYNTICYTTQNRQKEAFSLSSTCDMMLVIGDSGSSNTMKLYDICKGNCQETYLVDSMETLKKIKIKKACDTLGVVAGASAPTELITEVIHYMVDDKNGSLFRDEVAKIPHGNKAPQKGKIRKVTVASSTPKGIIVNLDGKIDGFIPAEEVSLNDDFNPDAFTSGEQLEVMCISDKAEGGVYQFSKKAVDKIKEGDKAVDTIRNGEEFSAVVDEITKGGLLCKGMGRYKIFVPASQIKERFVTDLSSYKGKTLRLSRIEIDDARRRIVASQKVILEKERKEKEDIFWTSVVPGVVVTGKVKNIASFGVFVSVDGFDCLVRLTDISWAKFKSPEDILQKGKKYDFVVLSADREKGKVALGYKQLQKHPFDVAVEKYPIGSTFKGKISSILPFGAFVEIVPGVEGLIHVSEASNTYVKNINDVFKPGDEVEVKVTNIDSETRKFTLSAKACMAELPVEEKEDKPVKAEKHEPKAKASKKKEEVKDDSTEWREENDNNVFADLLKDIDIDKK